nr:hypothetical protein [uncultured Halomonas sp.]
MITVLEERPAHLPMAMACRALGINRSTVYPVSTCHATAPGHGDPRRGREKLTLRYRRRPD